MDRKAALKEIVGFTFKRLRVTDRYGDKSSHLCPRCGKSGMFYSGRFKSCIQCGYSNFYNQKIKVIRGAVKNGNTDWMPDDVIAAVIEYIRGLKSV